MIPPFRFFPFNMTEGPRMAEIIGYNKETGADEERADAVRRNDDACAVVRERAKEGKVSSWERATEEDAHFSPRFSSSITNALFFAQS